MMAPLRSLADWLDERTGVREIARALFARKIPPGTGWIYTLGSVSLFLLLLQIATGIFMAMSYAPTPDHAFDSVRYLMEEAPFGAILRGLHVWGASAMVVVVLLHLLRTFLTGSYKFPRELTWSTGVLLLLFVFGFGFTGYLLPWNQKAYWATQVGTRIAEQAPLVGPAIARVLRGGDELGAQTLTRFYAIHTLLLPALVVVFVGIHLFLVVRLGISTPPRRGEVNPLGSDPVEERQRALADYHERKEGGRSFYPYTLAKDAAAVLAVFAVIATLAWLWPPEVGEVADPTETSFNPRPEWYFLWLFQLLKYFPGWLESVAAVVLPTIGVVLLLALPYLDRGRQRHPRDRRLASVCAAIAVAAFVGLTIAGVHSPLVSPYVPLPTQVAIGSRIFHDLHCEYCHSVRGRGGIVGPDLAFAVPGHDAQWIRAHFQNPSAVVPGSPMPALGLLDEETVALMAYIDEVRGGGPYSEKAPRLFKRYCTECHSLGGRGGNKGPDLSGIGSARGRSFIHRYTEDPKRLLTGSRMPVMLAPEGPLSHEQIEDIARYLAAQTGSPPPRDPQGGEKTP